MMVVKTISKILKKNRRQAWACFDNLRKWIMGKDYFVKKPRTTKAGNLIFIKTQILWIFQIKKKKYNLNLKTRI